MITHPFARGICRAAVAAWFVAFAFLTSARAQDSTPPTVLSVAVPSDGFYVAGQPLNFIVTTSEVVSVTANPRLELIIGGATVYANFVSGSGSDTLTFRYTVVTGDFDDDGIAVASSLDLTGGTITDGASHALVPTLNNVASTVGVLVDTEAPFVVANAAPVFNTYPAGEDLDFTVTYSEPVFVTGLPAVAVMLDTGGVVNAVYRAGNGSDTIVFHYTLEAGQVDDTGLVLADTVTLNGGTIRDAAGNDAALGTLSFNVAGVKVDGIAPTVESIVRQNPASGNVSGGPVTYRVTFSEAVTGVAAVDFEITGTDSATGTVGSVAPVSGTVYDVIVSTISGLGTVRLDLKSSGTEIKDVPGNAIASGFTGGEVYTTVGNQQPSFTAGSDLVVPQNAGGQTFAGWATNISAGNQNEAGQTLTFNVTAENDLLFLDEPVIDASGTLRFTPNPQASGRTKVTVVLHDSGGTANGGVDNSEPAIFYIAVTSYIEELGTYNGLVQSAPSTPISNDKTGIVKVTVGKKGALSGVLKLAGSTFVFSGSVDASGTVRFGKKNPTATFTVKRKNQTPLELALVLDVGGGTDQITGTITENGAAFAVLTADRNLYTSKKNPVAPLRNVPSEWLGKYTIVFQAKTPVDQGIAAEAFPQGHGCGFLTVSTNGSVKLDAMLADGTHVVSANALSKGLDWPFYTSFGVGQGSISGVVQFRDDQVLMTDLASLNAQWFKAPNPKAKYYPAGWIAGIRADLIGSKFVIPPKTPPMPILPGLGSVDLDGNAAVELTAGGLTTGGLNKALNITEKNVATVVAADVDKLTLNLRSPLGKLSGTFMHGVSLKKTSYRGVIFQKRKRGLGYFLGPDQSGAVQLDRTAAW